MSWWQTAKVGDKIVFAETLRRGDCEDNRAFATAQSLLVTGRVLTIAKIKPPAASGIPFFSLAEAPAPLLCRADLFRPVAPLGKRMDELRGLLDPKNGPWGQRETAPEKVSE